MPVGTAGAVKGMHCREVRDAGAEIVLGNTYHLMLRPGAERVAALGGLHKFMNWPRPILTDSGGFQVMSLSELRKLEREGVTFRSHIDGAMVELSPERAIEIQRLLGADIACSSTNACGCRPSAPRSSARCGCRCAGRAQQARLRERAAGLRALFGIVQGGDDPALRHEARGALTDIGFTATPSAASRSASRRR
jgi:queuine tRNA-ribosyltransferase